MNIITADFNWISLLIILGVSIFGMLKSANSKKQPQRPIFQEPDFQLDDGEAEMNEILHYQEENTSIADHYQESVKLEKREKNIPVSLPMELDEEEEHIAFDIRQAIISSEILKRPQF